MHLKTVFTRFYKSFNDDYLRKNDDRVKPKPWEMVGDAFYPYIEVPIDSKITTIVGANESGKSHLLSAIEKSISGEGIRRSDFCRYSAFFTVRQNELKYPDFGSEWSNLSKIEEDSLRKIARIPENVRFDRFLMFRKNIDKLTVYLPEKGDYRLYPIDEAKVNELQSLLPFPLKIESDIALPASVPIKKSAQLGQRIDPNGRKFEVLDREQRGSIIDALDNFSNYPELFTKVRQPWGEMEADAIRTIQSIISALEEASYSNTEKEKREKEFELAYKLICKIAQVDVDALVDLADAVKNGMQGYANGIVEKINRQLAINLNFPSYWVQDRNFCLKVVARDYDLVFTITDRTGTEYSFDERSVGLKYFLSYYIQYRSHEPHQSKSEILLMDEPDAYLSSQAQQDLLKIFDLFASPEKGSHLTHPIQVVYVTHSPFLIDKNHAQRIRVLQKGNEDEGTRVVKDAAKNHYEPLRSSIGAYVGETTFIGNCNLMVEGLTDQILIAGAATYLRMIDTANIETLDLNQVTIVPSGSASHIPYLVYLARGRDVEQPAVVVVLDSDSSGDEAKKQLLGKGGQHRKPLLKEQFILQIGDLKDEFNLVENITAKLEIEDIIPLPICIEATRLYLQEFLQVESTEISFFTRDLVLRNIVGRTVLDAIKISLSQFPDKNLVVNKVGFARNIIYVINHWLQQREAETINQEQAESLHIFEQNFKVLFRRLNSIQRRAQQRLTYEKISQKIERLKKSFIALHPMSARREDAVILLEGIEGILESNIEDEAMQEIEAIKSEIQKLRLNYYLDTEMNNPIHDYIGFQMGLERVKYAGLLSSQEETVGIAHVKETTEREQSKAQSNQSIPAQLEAVEKTSFTAEAESPDVGINLINSAKRKKNI